MDDDDHAQKSQVRSLVSLLRATSVLGMAHSRQLDHLDSIGRYHDDQDLIEDLALEFDDAIELLDDFVRLGWLADEVAHQFRLVDGLLAEMSGEGNEKLWTRDALADSELWEDVRRAAQSALLSL